MVRANPPPPVGYRVKSNVNHSSAVSLPINRKESTLPQKQLKFWCECGIKQYSIVLSAVFSEIECLGVL